MTWILIVLLSGNTGATSQQIELPSKEACQWAAKALVNQKAPFEPFDRIYTVCVQKR